MGVKEALSDPIPDMHPQMQNPAADRPTDARTALPKIHRHLLRPQNRLRRAERGEGLGGQKMVKLPTTSFLSPPPLVSLSSSGSSAISSSLRCGRGSAEDK